MPVQQTNQPTCVYTYEQMHGDLKMILRDIVKSRIKYHMIVTLPRGGLVPAAYLAYHLGIEKVVTFDEYCRYKDADPEISISSQNILVVDDISDTGETLNKVANYFAMTKNAGVILSIATLLTRAGTKKVPDYFGTYISGHEWILFPWDVPL